MQLDDLLVNPYLSDYLFCELEKYTEKHTEGMSDARYIEFENNYYNFVKNCFTKKG